tara:strand:- start:75 stop:257 length:183 start_codon:yes stop_codon:yes gene_type:complete
LEALKSPVASRISKLQNGVPNNIKLKQLKKQKISDVRKIEFTEELKTQSTFDFPNQNDLK